MTNKDYLADAKNWIDTAEDLDLDNVEETKLKFVNRIKLLGESDAELKGQFQSVVKYLDGVLIQLSGMEHSDNLAQAADEGDLVISDVLPEFDSSSLYSAECNSEQLSKEEREKNLKELIDSGLISSGLACKDRLKNRRCS